MACSERKVLLAGCWWLVCSERKILADKPNEEDALDFLDFEFAPDPQLTGLAGFSVTFRRPSLAFFCNRRLAQVATQPSRRRRSEELHFCQPLLTSFVFDFEV
jgi:hypothetical protein